MHPPFRSCAIDSSRNNIILARSFDSWEELGWFARRFGSVRTCKKWRRARMCPSLLSLGDLRLCTAIFHFKFVRWKESALGFIWGKRGVCERRVVSLGERREHMLNWKRMQFLVFYKGMGRCVRGEKKGAWPWFWMCVRLVLSSFVCWHYTEI